MPRSLQPDAFDPSFDAEVQRVREAIIAEEAAEAKAAFHLRMRGFGIQDLSVLRAFEVVPRQTFVPDRYTDLAARDLALPIGCGQTLDEPWLLARMIETLGVERGHRVLQVGAGTGYATAILARMASEVVGLERYQSLALSAQQRLTALDVPNAAVVWADGFDVPRRLGRFERIIVHGALTALPEALADGLTAGGVIVCGLVVKGDQWVVRIVESDGTFSATPICASRLQTMQPGRASAL